MDDLGPDPLIEFDIWYAEAVKAGTPQPEAMALATADQRGRPSVRMVLLKGWGTRGFEFFTNVESRKGRELAANPWAAVALYWQPKGRQIRAAGRVTRLPRRVDKTYWDSRPLGSQASAWASAQSRPLSSRAGLEARQAALMAPAKPLPLPPSWGGYRLRPDSVEFWEHRDDRLHRRLLYTRRGSGWEREDLQP